MVRRNAQYYKPILNQFNIGQWEKWENNVLGLPRDPPHPAFLGGDEITEIPSSELEKPITVRVKNPHLMCTVACRMWGSPFLSAVDKALPKRAPIAQWSGYKTRLVSDIFALC